MTITDDQLSIAWWAACNKRLAGRRSFRVRTEDALAVISEIQQLRGLLDAILAADERGQGLPYAEAMKTAHTRLESVRACS